ncbi:helix-turn-helix domain-containing protein [Caldisalinibacter kiritimatiensis]|uniref:Helix-turn-helix domain protein n=1 Tax=Caldisalinibacter kiritimatiensis TaxID=1304284 RepID=R1CNF2_9FIRM|nr:helix-turn-helix transcriptional regulator [Caldisalinibacter kiritimatiensis]EOD00241.1 Helix-turn-helix domain protein [Caldisalinibacter kiritimatiensis]
MKDLQILSPGKRLKKVRKMLKVKQDELAGDMFCKNYISMFENDRRKINAINATYLANKVNEIAKEKRIDLQVSASYFLKSSKDIAQDKCEKWIEQVSNNYKLSNYKINLNLYKTMYLAEKFGLEEYIGDALYLKGINSINAQRYTCAIPQFLEAIVYFSKYNKNKKITDTYKNIAIAFYEQKQIHQALSVLNLAEGTAQKIEEDCYDILKDIRYYKGLCYFALGNLEKSKAIIDDVEDKDEQVLDLENKITDRIV